MSTSSQEENVVASVKSLADLEKIEKDAIPITEAAEIIGVSTRRIHMFIAEGRLGMTLFGRHIVTRSQAVAFGKIPRLDGRPPSSGRRPHNGKRR